MRAAFLRSALRSLLAFAVGAGLAACGGPTPTTIDVDGRVVDSVGEPLAGVLVHAGGAVATTDASGGFRFAGLRAPYALVVASTVGDGWVHAYEGLSDPTPVLAPVDDGPAWLTGVVRGAVWGGAPVPDGHQVLVCAEGQTVPVWGCGRATAGDVEFASNVGWTGSLAVSVRLHALWMQVDGLGWPVGYSGYRTADVLVASEATTVHDLVEIALLGPAVPATVSVTAPGGFLAMAALAADVGGAVAMPLVVGAWPVGPVEVPLPPVALAARAQVVAMATYPPSGGAGGWATADAGAPLTLVLDAPPQQLAPVEDAVGVTLATPFSVASGPATARRFSWSPSGGTVGPTAHVTTAADTVRLPDLTPFGLAFPAGGRYDWSVTGLAVPPSATAVPTYPAFLAIYGGGGAPLSGDARFATSGLRTLTLAP